MSDQATGGCDFDALVEEAELGPARRLGSVAVDLAVRSQRTGFTAFDRHLLVRASRPDLCVIGARPGNGKTSFLVQVLRNVVKAGEGAALMFSLEMDAGQLKQRAMASELKAPINRLQHLPEQRLKAAEQKLETEEFYVDDTSGLDINRLRQRAMARAKRSKLAAVGVDYLQIVRSDGGDKRSQVGAVAEGLKTLAKDLGIPVIALAQMSRDIEKRQQLSRSARPAMSDLQECSLVENWADQIVFLDGAGKRDPSRAGQIDTYVAKNRHGPIGEFVLAFDPDTTTFKDFEEGI